MTVFPGPPGEDLHTEFTLDLEFVKQNSFWGVKKVYLITHKSSVNPFHFILEEIQLFNFNRFHYYSFLD